MVLGCLADALEARGHRVLRIDPVQADTARLIESARGRGCVLVTSDHFHIDTAAYYGTTEGVPAVMSVLELADAVEARAMVCAPHDLTMGFEPQDLAWIGRFDLVLVPDRRLQYLGRVRRTLVVGWPRMLKAYDWAGLRGSKRGRAVHFLSGLITHFEKRGVEQGLKVWKPLYDQGVSVKLPLWSSSDRIEQCLREAGASVIPAASDNFDVMNQHEVIITNGGSSVAAEAALAGRHPVHVCDPYLSPIDAQRRVLAGVPNVVHVTFEMLDASLARLRSREPELSAPAIKPFDTEAAVAAVMAL